MTLREENRKLKQDLESVKEKWYKSILVIQKLNKKINKLGGKRK